MQVSSEVGQRKVKKKSQKKENDGVKWRESRKK